MKKTLQQILLQALFMLVTVASATAQNVITGRVTDAVSGDPLIGAYVIVKTDKEAEGASTDLEGKFTLSTKKEFPLALHIEFVGYRGVDVDVYDNSDAIEIQLQENYRFIDEVVVVGYGQQKKGDLTGAVSSVKLGQMKSITASSFNSALAGSVAGVQVTPTSGAPGGGVSIRVRGSSSVQGGNEPLYVIDGFPVYGETFSQLNPGDIESINILKDASATAIYGSRGANGVVIVTTKNGSFNQKTQVVYDGSIGVQSLRKKIDVLNAREFAQLRNDALYDTNPSLGKYQYLSQSEIDALGEGTDWQDAAFRSARVTSHQLTVSGGGSNVRYSISGSYFDQDGIIRNTGFSRFTTRANLDIKLNNKLRLGLSLNGNKTDTDNAPSGIISSLLLMPPTATIYEADGSYTLRNPFENVFANPIASINERIDKTRRYYVLANAFAEWEIIKNLRLKVAFGANISNSKNKSYVPSYIYDGASSNGSASISSSDAYSWLNENTLTYDLRVKRHHSFNFLLGYTQQVNINESFGAGSNDYVTDDLLYNNLASGSVITTPSSSASKHALISYLGRVNYNFRERYYLSASLRTDGSSRFGSDKKWGVFPSVGASWNVANEKFFKPYTKIVSDLKARISYGVTGNQEIGNYQSLSTLSSSRYLFNEETAIGFRPDRISNAELGWETTHQYDAGIDAGLFGGRLNISLDYYYKKTEDLLLDVAIPWTSGYSSSLQNYGSVSNKGFEFTVSSKNFTGKKFSWDTQFNISFNRNKVLELGGGVDSYITSNMSYAYIVKVGEPLGLFYGAVVDGVLQEGEVETKGKFTGQGTPKPGDLLYKDIDGDGTFVSASDRTIIGKAQPDFLFSLTNNFTYANFDLSIFLHGVVGNELHNGTKQSLELFSGQQNADGTARDRWTETNASNTVPRAKLDPAPVVSNRFIEDGTFVRIKNITLGYTFGKRITSLLGINSLRVYASATNPITWTSYSGFDPEVTSGNNTAQQGYDSGIYPVAKSYNFGVNIKF
ncbi:MAG: TonB-dependent receptor [Bacteroidaceae bacterium]|nr:TonB-dependent receptor [Bacteroidaceae bacterium]